MSSLRSTALRRPYLTRSLGRLHGLGDVREGGYPADRIDAAIAIGSALGIEPSPRQRTLRALSRAVVRPDSYWSNLSA